MPEEENNEKYLLNELRSLGLEPKRKSQLNDADELRNLADNLKLGLYQDYKTAYGERQNRSEGT